MPQGPVQWQGRKQAACASGGTRQVLLLIIQMSIATVITLVTLIIVLTLITLMILITLITLVTPITKIPPIKDLKNTCISPSLHLAYRRERNARVEVGPVVAAARIIQQKQKISPYLNSN